MIAATAPFSAVLVAALAVGIGLTTSIFSVFYGVLLKPLPFRNPQQLVLVREKLPNLVPIPINVPAPQALDFAQARAGKEKEPVAQALPLTAPGTGGGQARHGAFWKDARW